MSRDHPAEDTYCPTGKRTFSSRATAKRFIKRSRDRVHHGESRTVYRCDRCDQFHITSWTARQREETRQWRADRRTL